MLLSATRILLFVIILSFFDKTYGSVVLTDNCRKAYSLNLSLRFSKAASFISWEQSTNASNRFPAYLQSQAAFIKAFISEEPQASQAFQDLADKSISLLSNENKSSLLRSYALGELYVMLAVIQIKEMNYAKGAWNLRKGFLILDEARIKNPLFLPVYKTIGLLHAVLGTIPDQYVWIADIVGVKSSITQGRNELISLVEACNKYPDIQWLRVESLLFLSLVEMNLQNNQNSASFLLLNLEKSGNDLQTNQILAYTKAGIEMHVGRNDDAIKTLSILQIPEDAYKVYYLDYMRGIALLQKQDKSCFAYFFSYVNNYKGSSYIKSAYQKLGWYYLLDGQRDKYLEYVSKAKLFGTASTDPDKIALKEATVGPEPDPVLLRARLLSDGGYWMQALHVLNSGGFDSANASKRNQIECVYRYARIYEAIDSLKKAEVFYKRVISEGAEMPYYYAANSCLMLGRIYENLGQRSDALAYYKKCTQLKFDEYYNSITQKAKAGIARVQ